MARISTMGSTFLLLEQLLNHDLACLVSMHVLLSGKTRTKALEGRYRRRVLSLHNRLYMYDLMESYGDDRTPEGLHKWAMDDQEYLPTRCAVPAGTKICLVYQHHTGKMRDPSKRPRTWTSGYTRIDDRPPYPPISWHRVTTPDCPWPFSPEPQAREAWGVYDD